MHLTTAEIEESLRRLFGESASTVALSSNDRLGRRIFGVDLTQPLTPEQAELMVSLLDRYKLISFPNQGEGQFRIRHLERLANHFGAPIPHPKNYANYADYKKKKVPLALLPVEQQTSTKCDQAFPNALQCREDASSPAVYIVTNLVGSGPDKQEAVVGGLHWHTDIEFEPTPLSTSMFYVQAAPSTRNSAGGQWVDHVPREAGFYHPDSPADLTERRNALPLNGETAYADTASAYADLPDDQKRELDVISVRRRLRKGDPGWLIPLVYVNPRTGEKSLHSPIWASRGKNIAPVEVDGLSDDESRRFLDQLEAHILKPQYRYDHVHAAGDVTIWSNFATVHNAPPAKSVINTPEDARLMYRISCKGEPSYRLPRHDTDAWIEANILPPYRSPAEYVAS
ncbi:MAG: TauD/TfdA dioxygenase family protein [Pseudomonadales bacterium]